MACYHALFQTYFLKTELNIMYKITLFLYWYTKLSCSKNKTIALLNNDHPFTFKRSFNSHSINKELSTLTNLPVFSIQTFQTIDNLSVCKGNVFITAIDIINVFRISGLRHLLSVFSCVQFSYIHKIKEFAVISTTAHYRL